MIIAILLGLLVVFFSWLFIDFNIGRKKHLNKATRKLFPKRNGKWLLFGNGHDLYSNLFQEIREAKNHIHILFYIIKNDQVSKDFLNLLKKKAKEGVTVRLLLDRVGGSSLTKKDIKSLKQAGVHFSYSNNPSFPFFFYSLNHRNHRKITVIDGKVGFFGGFNIGKEYIGQDPKLGFWRDFHVKLIGDGVQDLQHKFLEDWKRATKENHLFEPNLFPKLSKGSTPLQFFPTEGVYIKEFLIEIIKKAKREIFIGTPYFIPGREVNDAILDARKRGVIVKIIVPLKADHPLVKEAAFPYFRPLLEAGCQIYQFYQGFYHGKTIIIDRELCDFGTANFDKRSFFLNDELNCIIEDENFIEKIRTKMEKDIRRSEQLTLERFQKRPLLQRSKEVATKLISGLL